MLERMNWRNWVKSDRELLEIIVFKNFVIGMDFIVGYLGESGSVFEKVFKNLESLFLMYIYFFIYSKWKDISFSLMIDSVSLEDFKKCLNVIKDLILYKNKVFR